MKNRWVALFVTLLLVFSITYAANYYYTLQVRTQLTLLGKLVSTPVALTGTAGAQVLTTGTVFTLSGTTKQTSITTSSADAGRLIYLITASTDTLVDGSNLKLAGDFNGTASDVLVLVGDGTNWYEVCRSAN